MATYTVINSNDSGTGSLRWAIEQANNNSGLDTINVDVDSITLSESIHISDSLDINGNGVTITQTGSDRLFDINDFDDTIQADISLNNLTLTGGNPVETGGAILSYENLSIIDSKLLNNQTTKRGGAVYLEQASLYIDNTVISDNIVQVLDVEFSDGGGIYVTNGELKIANSTVAANQSLAASIVLFDSIATIDNTQIINNPSTGIALFSSQAEIVDSTLEGNHSEISAGGILLLDNSAITVANSNIIDNVADFGGGLGIYEGSQATITNSRINHNFATNNGGGIDTSKNSIVNAINTTISGNSAVIGADVSSSSTSNVTLTDVNLDSTPINYAGETIELVFTKPNLNLVTVDRFYQYEQGFHFYTADGNESQYVKTQSEAGELSYSYENTAYSALSNNTDALTGEIIDGTRPVYRFFNQLTGAHLYTMDENEKGYIQDNLADYSFEGAAYYAFESNQSELETIPVYRMYNSDTGTHLFSADQNEIDYIQGNLNNFSIEGNNGIAFYVLE